MTDEAVAEPDSEEPAPGTPRWVKTSAIVALAVVAVFVIVMLVSGGEHGPGRHSGGEAPPSSAAPHVPPGGHGP